MVADDACTAAVKAKESQACEHLNPHETSLHSWWQCQRLIRSGVEMTGLAATQHPSSRRDPSQR